jgi:hypothetical protein
MEGPDAKTADRLVAARARKSHWLATVLKTYDGRSAIEVTVEPSAAKSRNYGAKIPVEQRVPIGLSMGPQGAPHIRIEERRERKREG